MAVVTSSVSKGFPIPDAELGAFANMLDILSDAAGDRRRWQTMPRLVLLFVPLEVLASLQFLIDSQRAGRSLYRTLLFGGTVLSKERDETPARNQPIGRLIEEFVAGGVG